MAASTTTAIAQPALLGYCRAGFEPELAAEFTERAGALGFAGYARTERGTGFVRFICDDAEALSHALPFRDLIFARQKMIAFAELPSLGATGQAKPDRVGAMVTAMAATLGTPTLHFGDVRVEHADSDEGKPLAALARALGNALRPALREAGWLTHIDSPDRPRLHVLLETGDHAHLGIVDPQDGSEWPMGIPRLRMHPQAPSRSALKLEEAFLTLLDAKEREAWFKENMHAADLGAAPGGWSWVLMRNGVRVISVDNGPLAQHLLDSGRVEHLRADGFVWHPKRTLDWMVCDMVEQPRRVAERMATWLREGWCRRTVFNLKLPMKKRWDETRQCLALFERDVGQPVEWRAKQLYHDREEITVFARLRG
ncbi:23S rRNA (cytidine(2498)-2'-O)-methyltransferase RlmM [Lysobacter sp. TY2-98]|uniref:23S rRNA (cytidine(2498)-2'-O)-methyltransferase RlmM n=1 Tax=Lysobacter sp. TY2-98 TaxID=2290922 RepID=UPI000E206081|nr:23S rRNA (cytidine(2498)-2'-O)-methyltransferase RlmM [Lysobacter sp. TY2-98]AXK72602.1 23S rRNA (cytidine(2498)-2'-O)-methyltransferase RlmM [Lysobacter sp. TY2-98]